MGIFLVCLICFSSHCNGSVTAGFTKQLIYDSHHLTLWELQLDSL